MAVAPSLQTRWTKRRLQVELATSIDGISSSRRLRYRAFAEELGADVKRAAPGIDEDAFDPYCQHRLVKDAGAGDVTGSTRLLPDSQAAKAGSFYSAGEFDITPLLAMPGRRLEAGRTCIDPRYRQGAAIAVLWSGLADDIKDNRVDMLFGCAGIEMHDGGTQTQTQAIMNRVRNTRRCRWLSGSHP
jgi:putative hemolysin